MSMKNTNDTIGSQPYHVTYSTSWTNYR